MPRTPPPDEGPPGLNAAAAEPENGRVRRRVLDHAGLHRQAVSSDLHGTADRGRPVVVPDKLQCSASFHAVSLPWTNAMRCRHISGALEYMGKCPQWAISASSTPFSARRSR